MSTWWLRFEVINKGGIMCKYCEEGKEKLLKYDYANTDFEVSLDGENVLSIAYTDSENDFIDELEELYKCKIEYLRGEK